jgi:hypothetical protein
MVYDVHPRELLLLRVAIAFVLKLLVTQSCPGYARWLLNNSLTALAEVIWYIRCL